MAHAAADHEAIAPIAAMLVAVAQTAANAYRSAVRTAVALEHPTSPLLAQLDMPLAGGELSDATDALIRAVATGPARA